MPRTTLALIAIAASLAALDAGSQEPQPVIRNGVCPPGYWISGNYCTPTAGSRPAIPKVGACPPGYWQTGNYCVARPDARPAVPKKGVCPAGYVQNGEYCLKRP